MLNHMSVCVLQLGGQSALNVLARLSLGVYHSLIRLKMRCRSEGMHVSNYPREHFICLSAGIRVNPEI